MELIKLVLFDVDGTLLDAGDLSKCSFLSAVRQHLGPRAIIGEYSLSGKTDPQIMRELLLLNGLPAGQIDHVAAEALRSYQSLYLAQLEKAHVRPLEGARELIERLSAVKSSQFVLGILTGNMEGLVAPKLDAAGIPISSFAVGAFGSDDANRGNLPAIAVERAERTLGIHLLPREVAVVGDTLLDVACARDFGAVSIAVASGDYTYAQLGATRPAYVLKSLSAWSGLQLEIGVKLPRNSRPSFQVPGESQLDG
jgi:phosphoglycolate phosphatase